MKVFKGLALLLALVMVITTASLGVFAEKPDTPPVPASQLKGAVVAGTAPEIKKVIPDFDFKDEEIAAIYRARSGQFTVSPVPTYTDVTSLLKQLSGNVKQVTLTDDQQSEASNNIEGSFLVVFKEGTRRVYSLSKGGYMQVGNRYFVISAENYAALLKVYKNDSGRASFAQWLIYMQPSRITGVTLESGGTTTVVSKESLPQIVQMIRGLRVTKGSSYSPKKTNFTTAGKNSKITISFGEEHYYEIMLDSNGKMYVESDELHIGCNYTVVFSTDVSNLISAIKNPTVPAKVA